MSQVMHFYATPGPMTDLSVVDPTLLVGLPEEAEGLCCVSKDLIVHEFLVNAYGIGDVSQRFDELETRSVGQIVAKLMELDPRPLAQPRVPETRLIGNCRQYTVVTCALLRRAGIPARARAGFSGYFGDGWTDHWVVEWWDTESSSWIRTDAQIDETQREIFAIQFDPLRLADDHFLTGSEAWRRYREGDDAQMYGIQDMRGPWFIAASVIRDLAALNKVEVHVWDTWGAIDKLAFRELSSDEEALIDRIAESVLEGEDGDMAAIYRQDGLQVPRVVTSNRFQKSVTLPGVA